MRVLTALVALCLIAAADATAGWRDRRAARSHPVTTTTTSQSSQYATQCANGVCTTSSSVETSSVTTTTVGANDALASVNAKRAARGLRPYVMCPLLTAAAERAASFRAANLMFGHTANDFSFLEGTSATAAGCAAYPIEYGFMSCAMYDSYTYAGAAWVRGRDGKMYCHIYVK
jgi:hypothetical protein